MIIYVCFIIIDGIALSNTQPIKTINEPKSPDLAMTTNLNPTEYHKTNNLIETNSKSRKIKKNSADSSISNRSIKVDSNNLTETNTTLKRKFDTSSLSLPGKAKENLFERSISVDLSSATGTNSMASRPNRSYLSQDKSFLERSISVDSSSSAMSIRPNTPYRSQNQSFSERSISVDSSSSAMSTRSNGPFQSQDKIFLGRSISVDSNSAEMSSRANIPYRSQNQSFSGKSTPFHPNISRRFKRSLFHVHHTRRSLSPEGRKSTRIEERRRDDDGKALRLDASPLRREKRGGVLAPPTYEGNILLTVQLFLLFIPLASASAVVLSVVPHWSGDEDDDDDDSSTWDDAAGDYARAKDESAGVADEFVLNRIYGADPLAKRLKLERMLGHQCPCLYDNRTEEGGKADTTTTATTKARGWYYAGLVSVLGLIAYLVYKIVVIVS